LRALAFGVKGFVVFVGSEGSVLDHGILFGPEVVLEANALGIVAAL
jgi:hypothetical protein